VFYKKNEEREGEKEGGREGGRGGKRKDIKGVVDIMFK
jgi:hypothetical protein